MKIANLEGIVGIRPVIKSISFDKKDYIGICLADGRLLYAPLNLYPSISAMTPVQKEDYLITDGQIIIWEHCDEVFHLEQFLGREVDYAYSV